MGVESVSFISRLHQQWYRKMQQSTGLALTLIIIIHSSLGLCPADPSKGEVQASASSAVPFLFINRGECSCPNPSYWLCYHASGRECSEASCQFIGSSKFAQIYGLRSGGAYTYLVAGACSAESDGDVKALLCSNDGNGFNGHFQLPAAAPTAPPHSITAMPKSYRELEVCWEEVPATEQNGKPTSYTIRCTQGCPQASYSAGPADSCLTIDGLTPLSNATVQVRMDNEAGAGPFSLAVTAVMKVKTPGNPPRYLRPLSSLSRSVTLLWYGPVSDALLGGPVTGYMIQLASNSTGKTEEREVHQIIGQSANSITFTVGGLKPVTEYAISVAAVNAFGVGVFSSAVMATTQEAAPDGPPLSVVAMPVSNSVVMVTCEPPTPELSNGVITGYSVEYCPCGMGECSEPARVAMVTGAEAIKLQNMQEQTIYCVRVAAHTSQGAGPWSGWVTVLTNLEAPPPPNEVKVSNISFSTAAVCWKTHAQNSVSEFIITYAPTSKYYTQTLNMRDIAVVIPFQLGEQLYCVTLRGMEENARYKVSVAAANSVGRSASVAKKFRTAIHAPSGAPTKVTVDCQEHTVAVSWCVPVKKDRNGRITGFEVELSFPGEAARKVPVTRTKQCQSTTFSELPAGKTYQVRVKASNAAGEGPFTEFLQARTKETAPGQPSITINPQSVQERSAFIVYSPPTQPNGDILHYMLTVSPIPASCHTQQQHELPTVSGSIGLFTVYGLLPGLEYQVCLAAVNSAGVGQPACNELSTKGATPPCAITSATPTTATPPPTTTKLLPTTTEPPPTTTEPPPTTTESPPTTAEPPPTTTEPPPTTTEPPPTTTEPPPTTTKAPPTTTQPPPTTTKPPPITTEPPPTTTESPTTTTEPPPTTTKAPPTTTQPPPTTTKPPPITTEPPPTTTESPTTTTEPPPTTTKAPPTTTKPPPTTTEPPPTTTESPPTTTEPPPTTTKAPPTTTKPPPTTTEPPPTTTKPPPTTTKLPLPTTTEPPPATTEPPPFSEPVAQVPPVCVDEGLVTVTLQAVGSLGVLVQWQQTCASSTLRLRDMSTNGPETTITLSSTTSLFFLSQATQLTAGSEYEVCVDMLCGAAICSGCSSVHTGP